MTDILDEAVDVLIQTGWPELDEESIRHEIDVAVKIRFRQDRRILKIEEEAKYDYLPEGTRVFCVESEHEIEELGGRCFHCNWVYLYRGKYLVLTPQQNRELSPATLRAVLMQ